MPLWFFSWSEGDRRLTLDISKWQLRTLLTCSVVSMLLCVGGLGLRCMSTVVSTPYVPLPHIRVLLNAACRPQGRRVQAGDVFVHAVLPPSLREWLERQWFLVEEVSSSSVTREARFPTLQ